MKPTLLFYNKEEQRSEFQLQSGIRPWGILMLTTAGKYTLELPELKQVYTVFPNMISYIPPNTKFVRKIEVPISFHQFHVRYDEVDPFTARLQPGILPIPKEQVSAIGKMLRSVRKDDNQERLFRHIAEHILQENYLFSVQAVELAYSEDILYVLEYMQTHLSENIRTEDMAALVGLSTTGLIWKFDRQLKTTPKQYLIQLRMQLAKQLLLESSLSVTQIAEACGYTDVYYFSNAFRQHTGVSPTTFRKSPRT